MLEELLNKLIEKGWKPFGEGCHRSPYKRVGIHKNYNKERTYVLFYSNNHSHWKVLRQVVSRESGLWQFVCENKLFPKNRGHKRENDLGNGEIYYEDERQYYVIESALCNEDELEQLLLYKIKIDE